LIDVLTNWHRAFNRAPLVAHTLRETFADRSLRIHSLPDSQRYATCDAEYSELLRRQYAALADIIGDHCVAFVTEPDADLLSQLAAAAGTSPSCVDTVPIGQLDPVAFDESVVWRVFACSITLATGSIDFLLRKVADDEIRNTIIVDRDFTRICHPYDGGMDLILSDTSERDSFRERYSDWLSQHPTGL